MKRLFKLFLLLFICFIFYVGVDRSRTKKEILLLEREKEILKLSNYIQEMKLRRCQ